MTLKSLNFCFNVRLLSGHGMEGFSVISGLKHTDQSTLFVFYLIKKLPIVCIF